VAERAPSVAPATAARGESPSFASRFGVVMLYAAAMGWLEAVVVVYIRGLLGIARTETIPPAEEVYARLHSIPWLLPTEQTREVATILMLAAVGWLGGRSLRARFGAFIAAFGAWDIVYYIGLYALLRWPPSLATQDLLFLIPAHAWWYQPVWLPVSIAALMVLGGGAMMRSERRAGVARR
jgi:hypothetical protein